MQSTLQAAATASFNVEMMLHSYSNPTHGYCGGQHCEGLLGQFFLGDCDNAFTFCLRRSTAGNSSCVSSTSTSVVRNNDDFTFTSDILNTLGITNPLVFSNLLVTVSYLVDTDIYSLYSCPIHTYMYDLSHYQGPLELLITIYDDDGIFGRHVVDQILIPFNSSLSLSSIFSSPSTHTGTCQKASLTLSYRITSNCPANMYGPSCSEVCVPQMDRSYCNYLGERQCSVNLAPPECETCLPDYYPPNICDILCQNDPHGHFTCDPATGQRQCIGNLAPPECETCLPDYYPPNTCDTFCRPRDDSQGHFTCDPTTGEKICLPGFTNIASDCTEVITTLLRDCWLDIHACICTHNWVLVSRKA